MRATHSIFLSIGIDPVVANQHLGACVGAPGKSPARTVYVNFSRTIQLPRQGRYCIILLDDRHEAKSRPGQTCFRSGATFAPRRTTNNSWITTASRAGMMERIRRTHSPGFRVQHDVQDERSPSSRIRSTAGSPGIFGRHQYARTLQVYKGLFPLRRGHGRLCGCPIKNHFVRHQHTTWRCESRLPTTPCSKNKGLPTIACNPNTGSRTRRYPKRCLQVRSSKCDVSQDTRNRVSSLTTRGGSSKRRESNKVGIVSVA